MRWSSVMSVLPFLAVHAAGATDVYRLAAGNWPPYIGADLPDGGSMGSIVSRAFAAVGARVEFEHMPFARAARAGRSRSRRLSRGVQIVGNRGAVRFLGSDRALAGGTCRAFGRAFQLENGG